MASDLKGVFPRESKCQKKKVMIVKKPQALCCIARGILTNHP
jgi:hypothetical protein